MSFIKNMWFGKSESNLLSLSPNGYMESDKIYDTPMEGSLSCKQVNYQDIDFNTNISSKVLSEPQYLFYKFNNGDNLIKNKNILENGGFIYSFIVKNEHKLNKFETMLVKLTSNLSCYNCELTTNKVSPIEFINKQTMQPTCINNINNTEFSKLYTCKDYNDISHTLKDSIQHILDPNIVVSTPGSYILFVNSYILPPKTEDDITAELISSYNYQYACNDSYTTVSDDVTELNTFRLSFPVISSKFYNICIQMKVTKLEDCVIKLYEKLLGYKVSFGYILERTQKSNQKQRENYVPNQEHNINSDDISENALNQSNNKENLDKGNKSTKIVYLYSVIPKGLLITQIYVILQTSLPSLLNLAITKIGSWAGGKVKNSVNLSRKYLLEM